MAERIYTPTERGFDAIQHLAIGITIVSEGQQHIGLLHRDHSSGNTFLLHLAWHHRLNNSPPKPSYAWVDPVIHPFRARQVAAICRKIWRANPAGIPYGFSPASECFDPETGKFLLGPARIGLTCASFVLAVFEAAGLRMIQYETWPANREGDSAWKAYVIDQLKETAASAKHIAAVESELDGVRFRPEEVAAASLSKMPASFNAIEGTTAKILDILRSKRMVTL